MLDKIKHIIKEGNRKGIDFSFILENLELVMVFTT